MKKISDLRRVESKNFSSLDEAESIFKEYDNVVHLFKTKDCCIDDNLNLVTPNGTFENSFDGLKSISKNLRIPFRFSEMIPSDLLQENVNRLFQENENSGISICISKKNNYIVDAFKNKRSDFDHKNILDILRKNTNFKIDEKSRISENQINIKTYADLPMFKVAPRVGDTTQFGTDLKFKWLIRKSPAIRLYSHTLSCTNGATFQKLHFNLKENFESQFQKFMYKSNELIEKFKLSNRVFVPFNEFISGYRTIKSIAGEENSNKIFETNKDVIKNMSKIVRKINKSQFEDNDLKLFESPVITASQNQKVEYPLTEKSYYDLFYNITEFANKSEQMEYLQRYSGQLIENISLN